jgi:hypothetical protein
MDDVRVEPRINKDAQKVLSEEPPECTARGKGSHGREGLLTQCLGRVLGWHWPDIVDQGVPFRRPPNVPPLSCGRISKR